MQLIPPDTGPAVSSRPTPISPSWRGWFIWSLSAIAFGYAFFQRVTPGVMVSDLMRDFAIGGGMLGVLSALYFYPYFLLQVPLGALLDRLGARLLMSAAVFLAALGSFLFGAADNLTMAYAGRILIGIGSAVGFLGSMSLAARWFPPHRFAYLTGLAMFLAMMSGVLGQGPLAVFVEAYGWRFSQYGLGIFGAILALMIFLFVRDAPPSLAVDETKEVQPWSDVWSGLRRAVSLWNTWKIALVAGAMSGPMLVLGGLWGVPYFMQAYDLNHPNAAYLVSLLLFGWALGAPASGWLSDRLHKRKALLVGGLVVLTATLGAVAFLPTPPLAVSVGLLVLVGFSGAAMVPSFALVRETSQPSISGSVSGIVNAMTVASGALLQPVVGFVLDYVWDGTMLDGSRIYQAGDYQTAFIILFLTSLGGLVISLTLPESPQRA
ncbi:MAG: MFS transporter [Rhizobiaceae bacterium]